MTITRRELEAHKVGTHQNAENWDYYRVIVIGPQNWKYDEFYTFASGTRDAKSQALKYFNK